MAGSAFVDKQEFKVFAGAFFKKLPRFQGRAALGRPPQRAKFPYFPKVRKGILSKAQKGNPTNGFPKSDFVYSLTPRLKRGVLLYIYHYIFIILYHF